jgi:hypothetical protein
VYISSATSEHVSVQLNSICRCSVLKIRCTKSTKPNEIELTGIRDLSAENMLHPRPDVLFCAVGIRQSRDPAMAVGEKPESNSRYRTVK